MTSRAALMVQRVDVVHTVAQHGLHGTYMYHDVNHVGYMYILKPRDDVSGFKPTWFSQSLKPRL